MKQYKPNRNKLAKKFKSATKKATRQELGYDKYWYAYRARFLHHNPKCYMCGSPSEVIDHILRARGNEEYFTNNMNHAQMCTFCHSSITQKFDKKKEQDLNGKIQYIQKMRKFNRIDIKIKVVPYTKR